MFYLNLFSNMKLFITSEDYINFENPIEIINYKKVEVLGKKALLVELEKELNYSEFGITKPISKFILIDRHFNNRIHILEEFPIEVHVFIPNDFENPLYGFSKWSDLFNAAWTEIYNNYEAAKNHE